MSREFSENAAASDSSSAEAAWFPGHMAGAGLEIGRKAALVDIVIEVRDARLPLSSANSGSDKFLGHKKKIVVCNKKDLTDPQALDAWHRYFRQHSIAHLFLTATDKKDVGRLQPLVQEVFAPTAERFRKRGILAPPTRLMVIGVPNCGKSTLINTLGKGKKARVGAVPGITQKVAWYVLDQHMELLDTPGIVPAQWHSEEHILKMHCAHSLPLRDEQAIAVGAYLLSFLMRRYPKQLVERYGAEVMGSTAAPAEAVGSEAQTDQAIAHIARSFGCVKKNGVPFLEKACLLLLKDFRERRIGRVALELPDDFSSSEGAKSLPDRAPLDRSPELG